MSGGAHDSARPPPARVPHSSLQSFPGGPATLSRQVQSRGAMGSGGTFQPSPAQVPMVRKRRAEGNAMAARGGRSGSGSVHSTTIDPLAEQSRCHVGPTILFDRSRPGTPTPHFNRFLLGRPLGGDECRADGRWVRAELFNRRPQAGSDGEEAAAGGKCDGGPAGGPGRDRYTVQRLLRWLSRTDVRWGPRFSSTAPGQEPPLLPSIVSFWAGMPPRN
jgi:hypothetical protein